MSTSRPSTTLSNSAPEALSSSPRASSLSIWAALLAVYLVWGSTYLAIRFAVAGMPPFLMAGARFLVAGGVLYGWRRLRGDPAPGRLQLRSAAVIGLFLLLGGNGCVVWAEQRIPSGIASLLIATVPLWMALIDLVRPGSPRPTRWALAGVLVGLVGVLVLIGPDQLGASRQIDLVGAIVIVGGALSWSIGSLYSRSAPLPSSPLLGTGLEMIFGGVGLFLLGTVTGEWSHLSAASFAFKPLASLVYLIVFGSWVGFSAYTWLLRAAPTSLVSTYAYVNPLVALALGFLLGDEPFTWRVFLAAAVIVGAVAMITALQPKGRGEKRISESANRR